MGDKQILYETEVQTGNPRPKMTNPDYGPEIIQGLKDARDAHQKLLDLLKPTDTHDSHYGEQIQAWQNLLGLSHDWMNTVNNQVNQKWLSPFGNINSTTEDASTAASTTAGHKKGYDYTPVDDGIKPGMTKPQAEAAKRKKGK